MIFMLEHVFLPLGSVINTYCGFIIRMRRKEKAQKGRENFYV